LRGQTFGERFELLAPTDVLAWRQSFEPEKVVRFGSALTDERALADPTPALADDERSRLPPQEGAKLISSRSRPRNLRMARRIAPIFQVPVRYPLYMAPK